MTNPRLVRVFISSPRDVRPERLIAEQVVARMDREFTHHFRVEAVLWEREPLTADAHFQELITPPHQTDIVVMVLWSRLGVPLPENKFRGALSGRTVTGTEWEFEDALAARRHSGKPDVLLFRKTAEVMGRFGDRAAVEEIQRQTELVDDFMTRWFRNAATGAPTAAFHEFVRTDEFEERLTEYLRNWLSARLQGEFLAVDVADTPMELRWYQGSPYRGLLSFERQHAAVFFGRTRARTELRELLTRQISRGQSFVLVVGASGSGKSSLVKAGVLPDLLLPGMIGRVALCRFAVTRPGAVFRDPLLALALALFEEEALPELHSAPLEYTPERLSDLLQKAPEEAGQPIRQGLSAAGRAARLTDRGEARLVLIVDQLEELFTAEGVTAEQRSAYVAALEALARSGQVWVIATLRSDFFDRVESEPQLATLCIGEGKYLLTPPDAAQLGQIIRQPAREGGVRFEVRGATGESLDETIRAAASGEAGSLPLLEYLLDQLWERRSETGLLTYAAYDALGGLVGAVGRRADALLSSQPEEVRAALPTVLRALVTIGQGARAAATARWADMQRFAPGSPAWRLTEALLSPTERLLVADGDGATTRVRVAHEALLTHWDVAQRQILEDRNDLQLRGRLEDQASRWAAASPKDQPSLLLVPGLPLSEAEDYFARRKDEIETEIQNFIAASVNAHKAAHAAAAEEVRRQIEEREVAKREQDQLRAQAAQRVASRTRVAAVVLSILLLIAAGIGWYANNQRIVADAQKTEADEQRRTAEQRKLDAEAQREKAQNATRLYANRSYVLGAYLNTLTERTRVSPDESGGDFIAFGKQIKWKTVLTEQTRQRGQVATSKSLAPILDFLSRLESKESDYRAAAAQNIETEETPEAENEDVTAEHLEEMAPAEKEDGTGKRADDNPDYGDNSDYLACTVQPWLTEDAELTPEAAIEILNQFGYIVRPSPEYDGKADDFSFLEATVEGKRLTAVKSGLGGYCGTRGCTWLTLIFEMVNREPKLIYMGEGDDLQILKLFPGDDYSYGDIVTEAVVSSGVDSPAISFCFYSWDKTIGTYRFHTAARSGLGSFERNPLDLIRELEGKSPSAPQHTASTPSS